MPDVTKIVTNKDQGCTNVEKIYIGLVKDYVRDNMDHELGMIDKRSSEIEKDFIYLWDVAEIAAIVAKSKISQRYNAENPHLRPASPASNIPNFS